MQPPRNSIRRSLRLILLSVLATLVLVAGGLLWAAGGLSALREELKSAQVIRLLAREYIGETDLSAAVDTGLAAMTEAAADRWSYYMDAETYDLYQTRSANQYQGIGVSVTKREDGGFDVLSVTAGGPAETAGLLAGDILRTVGGTDTAGLSVSDLQTLVAAAYGSTLEVTAERGGETLNFTVSCGLVYSDPVSGALLADNIGYLRIENFRAGAADSLVDHTQVLLKQGADRLILDVRSDPGGYVSELVDMLDYLLGETDIFVSVTRSGQEVVYTSDAACVDLPMVVLVDADSYSAAEFFAAALRECAQVPIVGQATTGKGRSQATFSILGGGALHLSNCQYLTPNRVDLSETGGLIPDREVELTGSLAVIRADGSCLWQDDQQLAAAVELLSAGE